MCDSVFSFQTVIPNWVTCAGKSALAVLHALLRMKMSGCAYFIQSKSRLLAVLRTSSEDYDTSSREIALRFVIYLTYPPESSAILFVKLSRIIVGNLAGGKP